MLPCIQCFPARWLTPSAEIIMYATRGSLAASMLQPVKQERRPFGGNAMARTLSLILQRRGAAALGTFMLAITSVPASAAWEPTRPVEFIVPAGTGGGADQMARTIQGIVAKHGLMK